MSKTADKIIKSMETHCKKWEINENSAYFNNYEIGLWIYHGVLFLHIWRPYKIKLNFIDQIRIWNALKKLKHKLIQEKVINSTLLVQ